MEEALARLALVVERSPADETEIVWTQGRGGWAAAGGGGGGEELPGWHSVEVRVRERGRRGFHRTGARTVGELENAVRLALGQARLEGPGPELALAPPGAAGEPEWVLHDAAVARLGVEAARAVLESGREEGDRLRLEWWEQGLAVANSRGLARAERATGVTLTAEHGRGAGRGTGRGLAAGSARTLTGLAAPAVVERARERSATGMEAGEPPEGELPVALSPEATAALVELLGRAALAARTFHEGTSFLAGAIGRQVLDPALGLRDDGTDPAGLAFPIDLFGHRKRPVELVVAGVPRTPAADPELAERLGLRPTPHATGLDEHRPVHLFLAPGDATPEALLGAADGGLWISALDEVHRTEPVEGRFRAVARGVRRIASGRLAGPLPDLVWTAALEPLLARVAALGSEPVAVASPGSWGATSAPAMALPATGGFSPAS